MNKGLPSSALYTRCDTTQFAFGTTAELSDGVEIIGQARAVEAIQFGIGIQHAGFNLYVLGPNGTGKLTAVRQFLSLRAPGDPTPAEWCYVTNFDQPHKPRALALPQGQARQFRQAMDQLVEELFTVIPSAFTSEEYRTQHKNLEDAYKNQQSQTLEALRADARLRNIALIQTPGGFAFAPMKEGEVISPDEFIKFSAEEQARVEQDVATLQTALERVMQQVPQWRREAQAQLKALNEQVADFAIAPLFVELEQAYAAVAAVVDYLHEVRKDVVAHIDSFTADEKPGSPMAAMMGMAAATEEIPGTRYRVNVMVDHSETVGAPVVYEDQPRYNNLIGRVEHVSQMGALLTNFTLIKPGALHQANGGYLVLDARDLLMQPYAWEGLKHALRTAEINIESLGQIVSLISTVSLEPDPIPLNVKVVLVGDRKLYYLLCQLDPDFPELFKVSADFEDDMPRVAENEMAFARLIAELARKEQLRHLTPAAVGRVLEQSARHAGDSEKLSIHMQSMSDLLREADYWARKAGHELADVVDIEQALDAQERRASRVRDRMQEMIVRETVLIQTDGSAVGQINGLAVYAVGHHAFGKPSRITARARLGKGEVIDIERQVELGGPLHSKGVLILSGFLGARYAAERPLPLSATLVFEQSYGGVDGDSASSAELYALLSVLADLPILQSLAVTGSVNQSGQVQAIGGVNEKIEGFFELCMARGLTGKQGVLIPQANIKHLMLKQAVVDAVSAETFHIYPVSHIDEGIELLTGVAAGELDDHGSYPIDSVNGRVVARLEALLEKQRQYAQPAASPNGESHDHSPA